MKHLILTTVLLLTIIDFDYAQKSICFGAGTNISSFYGYSFNTYPNYVPTIYSKYFGYYINSIFEIPLSKNTDSHFYFDFGLEFSKKSIKDTLVSGEIYAPSGYEIYSTRLQTSFYTISIPIMIKQTFGNQKGFLSIGLLPSLIKAYAKGEEYDYGSIYVFNPGNFENTIPINRKDTNVNSLGVDLKISLGCFFSNHFGAEFSFQCGLTNVYKENKDMNFLQDPQGGRFYIYSLGIIYQIKKTKPKEKKDSG